jgi:hypothetical protein
VGTDLLEVFHGRFHRFGEIDGDPGGHGHTEGVHLLTDPGKGQKGEVLVGILQRVRFGQLQPHADKVLVGQHGPLGQTGRAGGQAEVADLVGGPLIHHGFVQIRVFGVDVIAEPVEILDEDEPVIGPVGAHAAGVFVDHMLDARDPLSDLHNFVHLFLVVAKDHGDVHVVQQLGDFLGHGGLVDGQRKCRQSPVHQWR